MKPAVLPILLTLALTAGGVLLGRHLAATGPSTATTTEEAAASPDRPPRGNRPRPSATGEARHDLATLRAVHARIAAGETQSSRELSRLSVPALKELILGQFAEIAGTGAPTPENFPRYTAIRLALAELYRQEGPAALDWAAALQDEPARLIALQAVLQQAMKDHPDLAKPWLDRLTAQYGRENIQSTSFIVTALDGARERGAEEMVRLMALFGDQISSGLTGPYPADFDFPLLFAAFPPDGDFTRPLLHWALRDRDAAWAAVKGDFARTDPPRTSGRNFLPLLTAAVMKDGGTQGAAWAAARLAELPPDQRAGCARDIAFSSEISVESAVAFAAALPPEDRKFFTRNALLGMMMDWERPMAIITALPHDEAVDALIESVRGHSPTLKGGTNNHAFLENLRRFFTTAESRLSLTPEEQSRLQQAME